ncbi:MAG TPA: hypothetical protein VFP65_27605 [Anaeromyxobacteraceae bacterium]|nr:hypothetical protein [Anaeromyxobacteraceae bacterium]
MTALVALLTLLAAPAASAATPAMDGYEALEHVALPDVGAPLELRVRSLERVVELSAPRGLDRLAQAARRAPRAICPEVTRSGASVLLRCRSTRLVARLVPRSAGTLLEIGEARGLPWSGEDAPPIAPYDPVAAQLGEACPGSTPGGRAECLLAQGDLAAARAALALDPGGAHAELRLGDLALAGGDARAAATHWARVRGAPWERVAAARMCELAAPCLASPAADALYALDDLPAPVARELLLRRARALAFAGRPLDALRGLVAAPPQLAGACAGAPATCQRVALAALAGPGAGVEALTLWIDLPSRSTGPSAYPAEVAAAGLAAREGAPAFAANVLAAAAARAPAADLPQHLLRTAELYLEAGDRVRAGVVAEFARARNGSKALPGARWSAVRRQLAAPSRPRPASTPPPRDDGRELAVLVADAARAVRDAQALPERGRP